MTLFWPSDRYRTSLDGDYARAREFEQKNDPKAPAGLDPNTSETNERVDQLLIVCAAMWELLSERTNLTENDLVGKVAEIDARDGVADGRITPTARPCPKCQRVIFPKHRRCLYCGCEIPADTVFKTI